jgi:hypothetical protein
MVNYHGDVYSNMLINKINMARHRYSVGDYVVLGFVEIFDYFSIKITKLNNDGTYTGIIVDGCNSFNKSDHGSYYTFGGEQILKMSKDGYFWPGIKTNLV